jgi:2-iminobutanoate/2-iminopropanoate deaminase
MKKIQTNKAPQAIGPYSQAIVVGNMLFASWQIWLDPQTMKLVDWIENQTHQVCKNLKAVLEEAGFSIENVVKTTIYLKNIEDFKIVNEIYWQYFSHKPARSTIQVAKLPLDALIEIDVIAVKN